MREQPFLGTRLIYEQLGLWSDVAARAEAISLIHVSDRGRFRSNPHDRRRHAYRSPLGMWWKING